MASNFFNQNNPYNVAMSTIGDLAMLSIAWFVGSIPIVTIGVSTSAACEVARTMQEARDHGIFRGYIAAYKRRIGTNLILSLIIAAIWALAAFDLRFLSMQQGGDAISVVYGITVAIFAILGVMLAFVLPLSGRSKLGVQAGRAQTTRRYRHLHTRHPADRAVGHHTGSHHLGADAVDPRGKRRIVLAADPDDPQSLQAGITSGQ